MEGFETTICWSRVAAGVFSVALVGMVLMDAMLEALMMKTHVMIGKLQVDQ